MRRRLVAAATASGVVLLGTTGPSLASSPATTGGKLAAVPDLTVLFGQAVSKIRGTQRPIYGRAVVYEADGITRGGRCTPLGCTGGRGATSASGVVSWRFVFDNFPSRSRFKSATLTYGPPPKRLGAVRGFVHEFAGDSVIPRAPKMTLAQAVALVRRAGHRAPFFNVTLRSPLGPKKSNPLYIFGFNHNQYFAVDTVTKKVRPFS